MLKHLFQKSVQKIFGFGGDSLALDPLISVISQFESIDMTVTKKPLLKLFHARISFALKLAAERTGWKGDIYTNWDSFIYGITTFSNANFCLSILKSARTSHVRVMRRSLHPFHKNADSSLYEKTFENFISNPYDLIVAINKDYSERGVLDRDYSHRDEYFKL